MTSFWSESYSTKKGILTEAYHRVCLEIDANDPRSFAKHPETFVSLSDEYFLHLVLKYQTSFNVQELLSVLEKLEQSSLVKPETVLNRLIVSISIPLSFISTYLEELKQLGSIELFKILFISSEGVIDPVYILQELQQLPLEDYRSKGISLGLRDFTSHDMIASFIEREAKSLDILQIIGVSVPQLPNLHTQSLELCHRHGILCLLSMPANYFSLAPDSSFQHDIMQYYSDLPAIVAAESNQEELPLIILFKGILQLGAILSFPYPITVSDVTVYVNSLSRLSHPFVHRKPFISDHRVYSLLLSEETVMALIEERSMMGEQEMDVQRVQMYSRVMPLPIELTFFPAEEVVKAAIDYDVNVNNNASSIGEK